MKLFRTTISLLINALALASPSLADTMQCPATDVRVHFLRAEDAVLVCDAVEKTATLFQQCALPPLPDILRIEIVADLLEGCVGLYHCNEAFIELLSPSVLKDRRDPHSAFGFLDVDDYFQSAVVHELAHAAIGNIPCPIDTCIVSGEYIAYAMQILSLGLEAQRMFAMNDGISSKVSPYDLSRIILFLEPDLFARTVGAHLSQRDDPCDFIVRLKDREILLDRERF